MGRDAPPQVSSIGLLRKVGKDTVRWRPPKILKPPDLQGFLVEGYLFSSCREPVPPWSRGDRPDEWGGPHELLEPKVMEIPPR